MEGEGSAISWDSEGLGIDGAESDIDSSAEMVDEMEFVTKENGRNAGEDLAMKDKIPGGADRNVALNSRA